MMIEKMQKTIECGAVVRRLKAQICLAVVCAAGVAAARPSFLIPERLYAAPGLECNIYYKDVFDSVVPQNFAFQTFAAKGRSELTRWCWTPEAKDAGSSVKVVVNAWNDDGLVASATTTVEVAEAPADPSRRITLALFGDSLANSRFQDRILADMREAGHANYTPVGSRKGTRPDTAAHDGFGGYTCDAFLTRYAMAEDEVANVQDAAEREQLKSLGTPEKIVHEWQRGLLRSPLVAFKGGRKTLDVPAWLAKVNDGAAPDIVLIELGVNSVFSYRGEADELRARIRKDVIPGFSRLISALRPHMPDSLFAVCTLPLGCSQDGFAANYGASWNEVQHRKIMFALNREIAEFVKEQNDRKLALVPVANALDPFYSYIHAGTPAHARTSEKAVRDRNAVHPSAAGGGQMGDAIAAWLRCRWNSL